MHAEHGLGSHGAEYLTLAVRSTGEISQDQAYLGSTVWAKGTLTVACLHSTGRNIYDISGPFRIYTTVQYSTVQYSIVHGV